MSKILKDVMSKVVKEDNVELKAEKVELELVDELKKYPKAAMNMAKEIKSEQKKAENALKEIRKSKAELLQLKNITESFLDDAAKDLVAYEKAAKKLGVNPRSQEDYASADDAYKALVELTKGIDRIIDNISSI